MRCDGIPKIDLDRKIRLAELGLYVLLTINVNQVPMKPADTPFRNYSYKIETNKQR